MAQLYQAPTANFVQTTLNGAITDSAGTITLNSTTNLQAPGYVVIDRINSSGTATPNAREVVSYTGISGQDLTGCTRGADNSTARSHSNGAIVETVPTVGMWNDLRGVFNTAFTADGLLKAVVSPVSIAYAKFTRFDVASIASIAQLHATRSFFSNLTIANSMNASGASIVGLFPSAASGAVLTSRGNELTPVYATAPAAVTDGWSQAEDAWTYASATSFTIAGVDRTTTFTPGTRIKLTQTSAKYFVVTSSSFSTDTTVNVTGGTDYTLANAAITSPFYSYQLNPQGYPGWFAYTPTFGGFSADPANSISRFAVNGRVCTVIHTEPNAGTSNSTSFTVSAPITSQTIANFYALTAGRATDNGTTAGTYVYITSNSSTFSLEEIDGSAWQGSGNKKADFIINYNI